MNKSAKSEQCSLLEEQPKKCQDSTESQSLPPTTSKTTEAATDPAPSSSDNSERPPAAPSLMNMGKSSVWHQWLKKDKRLNHWEWPAYLIDIYRIFPRAVFIAASVVVYKMGMWYMFTITAAERSTEVTAFVTIVTGAWVKALDYYMQRGVDWSKRMQINGGESGANSSINISQS